MSRRGNIRYNSFPGSYDFCRRIDVQITVMRDGFRFGPGGHFNCDLPEDSAICAIRGICMGRFPPDLLRVRLGGFSRLLVSVLPRRVVVFVCVFFFVLVVRFSFLRLVYPFLRFVFLRLWVLCFRVVISRFCACGFCVSAFLCFRIVFLRLCVFALPCCASFCFCACVLSGGICVFVRFCVFLALGRFCVSAMRFRFLLRDVFSIAILFLFGAFSFSPLVFFFTLVLVGRICQHLRHEVVGDIAITTKSTPIIYAAQIPPVRDFSVLSV